VPTTTHRPIQPPSPLLTLLENRAIWELGAFIAASPFLRAFGRGDRHPVLVLPGFTAGDRSTEPLRWFLRGQGYYVHGWHLGRNVGPTRRIMTGIDARLFELHERHEKKVSIIGWSLGGIYARELARHHPHMVRQVITLGTPFRLVEGDHSAAEPLWNQAEPYFVEELATMRIPEEDKAPLRVPSTAIYTRTDGIVRWHSCIEAEGPRRENIEVHGSHSGLGVNPAALIAIADRLSLREGTWKPFKPPFGTAALFPRPVNWRAA
jgi:pimeloyl-ACP methyl ester carboxylesterase